MSMLGEDGFFHSLEEDFQVTFSVFCFHSAVLSGLKRCAKADTVDGALDLFLKEISVGCGWKARLDSKPFFNKPRPQDYLH